MKNGKKAVGLLALVLASSMLFACSGGKQSESAAGGDSDGGQGSFADDHSFKTRGKNYIYRCMNDDDELTLIFNGETIISLDEELSQWIYYLGYDYKQQYAFIMTQPEDSEYKELYIVSSTGEQKLADEVSSIEVSAFGDVFCYISDSDLYVGTCSAADEAKKIDSDVSYIAAMSPDGSAIAYVKESSDTDTYYISKNGEAGEVYDAEKSIFAISNDAKYVYYYEDGEDAYYVNDTLLAEGEGAFAGIILNRSGSQALINVEDQDDEVNCYLVDQAKEPVKLNDSYCEGILAPVGAFSFSDSTLCYNISSFSECALEFEYNYFYLKNTNGECEKLSELKNADNITLLSDNQTVLFIKNGSLRSANITKPTEAATEYECDEEIVYFSCSADGKHIYVYTDDGELGYMSETDGFTKIAEDLYNIYYVRKDGTVYYIDEDQDLRYYSPDSDSPTRLGGDMIEITYHAESDDIIVESEDSVWILEEGELKRLVDIG